MLVCCLSVRICVCVIEKSFQTLSFHPSTASNRYIVVAFLLYCYLWRACACACVCVEYTAFAFPCFLYTIIRSFLFGNCIICRRRYHCNHRPSRKYVKHEHKHTRTYFCVQRDDEGRYFMMFCTYSIAYTLPQFHKCAHFSVFFSYRLYRSDAHTRSIEFKQ